MHTSNATKAGLELLESLGSSLVLRYSENVESDGFG